MYGDEFRRNLSGTDVDAAKARLEAEQQRLQSGNRLGFLSESIDLLIAVGAVGIIVFLLTWL
ncbi:hypothetical protein [Paenibacillus sp. sgz500958]|uniref:hypothetical protein n=1 Tax=Paenibacillus sp. sgz500958 TaxID=3242475 RepID=UPI0036D28202